MKEGKRKMANTKLAKVYNPSRPITAGKPTAKNPVKKTTAKKNPTTKKVVNASSHKKKKPRRNNPASIMGLIGAALMVGIGVTIFDVLTARFTPQSTAAWRLGVKAGGAFLFQSSLASKIPVLGKYKNEIALVLGVLTVVDLLKWLVVPQLDQMTGGLLTGQTLQMQRVAASGEEGELGDDVYYYVEEIPDDYYSDDDEDEVYY